jgi:hypothetical protein
MIRKFGRIPSPLDERDYQLNDYLPIPSFWEWLVSLFKPKKYPTKIWDVQERLDQKDTGHCVGFSCADWGNTLPIDDKYTNADANKIYYECKVIDKEPKQENGSTVRSGCKALKNRKRLNAYAFSSTMDAILQWITSKGPVMCGTDWTSGMMNPDSRGLIKPTGSIVGGHAYTMIGYDSAYDEFVFLNSWGKNWAVNGVFRMKQSDFKKLFADQGEAAAAVELHL